MHRIEWRCAIDGRPWPAGDLSRGWNAAPGYAVGGLVSFHDVELCVHDIGGSSVRALLALKFLLLGRGGQAKDHDRGWTAASWDWDWLCAVGCLKRRCADAWGELPQM